MIKFKIFINLLFVSLFSGIVTAQTKIEIQLPAMDSILEISLPVEGNFNNDTLTDIVILLTNAKDNNNKLRGKVYVFYGHTRQSDICFFPSNLSK